MTTVRQAILLAADHIERNPKALMFSNAWICNDDGSQDQTGCPLVWIARFARFRGDSGRATIASQFLPFLGFGKFSLSSFFMHMDESTPNKVWNYLVGRSWHHHAKLCAKTLRAYADRWHPETKGIPDDIRAIFTAPATNPDAPKELDDAMREGMRALAKGAAP